MDTLLNWLLSNIKWEVVVLIFTTAITTWSSFKISKFLFKQNRHTFGNGPGKHYADRFIQVWRAPNGIPSNKEKIRIPNNACLSPVLVEAIDKELEKKGLVNIKDSSVYPVKNLRNKLIIKILKFDLIHCTGDNKKEYKDL